MDIPLRERLEAAEEAVRRAQEAAAAWRRVSAPSGGADAPDALLDRFCAIAERTVRALRAEADARRRRFDAVAVLQARLKFANGTTKRFVVAKPDDKIAEPHIGEMFHVALQKQGVVASLESYPVLVVDRRKRIVAEIPVSATM